MQHPDEGTIHAWIDGELSPEQDSEIATHVAGCAECAAMVAEARGLVAASTRILTALDNVPGGVIPGVPDIAPAQIARRRWYQRTELRAAAALLFVVGGSLLVTRRGVDMDSTRAMIATTEKDRPVPTVGSDAAAARQPMADAATSSSVATAPSAAEGSAVKPLGERELMRRSEAESGGPGQADQSLQLKATFETQSSRLQARDEPRSLKRDAAKTQATDMANVSPPVANAPPAAAIAQADAPAPPAVAARAEGRSDSADRGVVGGRVIDRQNGQGVSGAQVLVEGTAIAAITEKDGSFKIANVPPGDQRLRVRRLGYDPTTVPLAKEARGTEVANVALARSNVMLEEAVVTGVTTGKVVDGSVYAAAGSAPLRIVRADSTGSTKRTVYEVAKGVEVTLTESPVETVAERNATAREKAVVPQSPPPPAAQVETKQRQDALSGRAAGAVMSAPTPVLNSISWTERGRKFVLTGRLATKDLEALKARLAQARR
jgi:hypothetical protein